MNGSCSIIVRELISPSSPKFYCPFLASLANLLAWKPYSNIWIVYFIYYVQQFWLIILKSIYVHLYIQAPHE